MADRAKVMVALACCTKASGEECDKCTYKALSGLDCMRAMMAAEWRAPEMVMGTVPCRIGRCPKCARIIDETLYPVCCGFCGQKVEWG